MIERAQEYKPHDTVEPGMRAAWRELLEHTLAERSCSVCPCPSIELVLPPELKAEHRRSGHATMLGADFEGGGLILWVEDGLPTSLEQHDYLDTTLEVIPPVSELRFN